MKRRGFLGLIGSVVAAAFAPAAKAIGAPTYRIGEGFRYKHAPRRAPCDFCGKESFAEFTDTISTGEGRTLTVVAASRIHSRCRDHYREFVDIHADTREFALGLAKISGMKPLRAG